MKSTSRARAVRRRPTPAAPGLPITGADLDATHAQAREAADLERARIIEQAAAAAGKKGRTDGDT